MHLFDTSDTTQDFRFIYANPIVHTYLSKPADSLTGMSARGSNLAFSFLTSSETGVEDPFIAAFVKNSSACKNSKETVVYEFSQYNDTSRSDLLICLSHIRDNHFAMIAQDISSLKTMEQELRHQQSELEGAVQKRTLELQEALEVKSRFLATMSHGLFFLAACF